MTIKSVLGTILTCLIELVSSTQVLNFKSDFSSLIICCLRKFFDRAIDVYESKELYNKLDNKIKKSIDGKLILAQNKKWEMVMPGEQIPEIKTFTFPLTKSSVKL